MSRLALNIALAIGKRHGILMAPQEPEEAFRERLRMYLCQTSPAAADDLKALINDAVATYQPEWDLSTIPDQVFKSEAARRSRPRAPNQVLKDCAKCGTPLNATERRKACPQCGSKANMRKVQAQPVGTMRRKTRNELGLKEKK